VNKLVKRLRREVLANPKKGALLGLMVLVGVYFWAPLVAGWLGDKPPQATATAGASAGFPLNLLNPSTPTAKPNDKAAVEQPWHVYSDWMDRDPRKQPARPRAEARDPFQRVQEVVRQEPKKVEPPKKAVAAAPPALSLEGTLLGRDRRVAVINGRIYREGDKVQVTSQGQTVVLQLAEVRHQAAVLIYEGARLDVKMRPSALAGAIEKQ
jgi:hypothetical protein